uniref:Uncharacterized protein n=1 Tax=Plectus sambesii TaxID=2011161 RepID=A0A914UUU6_9BILA
MKIAARRLPERSIAADCRVTAAAADDDANNDDDDGCQSIDILYAHQCRCPIVPITVAPPSSSSSSSSSPPIRNSRSAHKTSPPLTTNQPKRPFMSQRNRQFDQRRY